ncbi:MAG: hypothetical protein ABL857_00840 [Rickettsiales bacterium]|jgi:hypothetical protein
MTDDKNNVPSESVKAVKGQGKPLTPEQILKDLEEGLATKADLLKTVPELPPKITR